MSITIHMHIQVKNFDDWKAVFDSAAVGRDRADIHATPYKDSGGRGPTRGHILGRSLVQRLRMC